MRARPSVTATIIFAFFWLLSAVFGHAAEPTSAEALKPAAAAAPKIVTSAPAEIPLGDIAARATEVSTLLDSLTVSVAPSAQIQNIAETLPEAKKRLEAHFAETTNSLEAEPTLDTLQSLQQDWQQRQVEMTGWLNALTTQATALQTALNQLGDLQKTWESTRVSAQVAKVPDAVQQQIDATLAAIKSTQAKIQNERRTLLDLQSRVAQAATKCGTVLAQISLIQQKAVAGIFVPDVRPIWAVDLWAGAFAAFPEHVRRVSATYWSDIVSYLRSQGEGGARDAGIFIGLALLFSVAQRKIAIWDKSAAAPSSAISVFDRPYAAAMAASLIFLTSPFFQMPIAMRQLLTILSLPPMARVVRPVVSVSVATVIVVFCFLLGVDTLRQAFAGGIPVIGQAILIAESLVAIIVLFWIRRHYRQVIVEKAESSLLIVLKLARFLVIISFLVGLLAGIAGYNRLARLLTPGIFVGVVLALAAFSYLRIISGVIALAFRVWPLRMLQMIGHHRELLERKIHRFLLWLVPIAWLIRYLSYLGLLDNAWSLGQALLATKLERGTIAISLGNVLEFFLTVYAAYLLSRFLRFVLQEDVYPRIDLGPGLSYAVSSLLNYIILALGFVAALGLLGVDFAKVSLLAGAFGVGIGFGLQSIVNNFISGLILLFERPIHVGDMVQLSSIQGRVQRIGIRASVIRTMQGAEIIVPNAQLITEQVTNWTLSDQLRRIDLPVGLSYGSTPKIVTELLEGVARALPHVLENPAPRALFISYGDSSINFELRVWTEIATWQQVHSDLTTAIYDAVYAAGMSFPFPQREVRLLNDHDTAHVTVFGDGQKNLSEDVKKL